MSISKNSIQRLRNTHYAINVSFENLKQSLKRGDDKLIYKELGDLLLWVLTADEWLCKNDETYNNRRNNDSSGKLLLGLRHAYNWVKHDVKCIHAHRSEEKPKFNFPISGSFIMGEVDFVWGENKEFKGRSKTLREKYIELLVGQNVLETFELAIPFLENEILKYD